MEFSEREPEPVIGFQEATVQLEEGDGLILSRNRVGLFRGGEIVSHVPVHYEHLTRASEMRRPVSSGNMVTHEFQDAAAQLIGMTDLFAGVKYPLLTVINHATENRFTETIDAARLIAQERLPVYGLPARSTEGGTMASLGVSALIRNLAQRVEVNPNTAIVIDDDSAHTIEEVGLGIWTHLPKQSTSPRKPSDLLQLQEDLGYMIDVNRHRVSEPAHDRSEIVVRLATQPDLQTILIELIDSIELRNMHLMYTNDFIATGEVGPTFLLLNDTFEYQRTLSQENTLGMAVYNAYLISIADSN